MDVETADCYLIVSPDPREASSMCKWGTIECFYFKFGDGNPDAYDRMNPSKFVAPLTGQPKRRKVKNTQGRDTLVQVGKSLEWDYLKYEANVDLGAHNTEWYRFQIKAQPQTANYNIEALRQDLVRLLVVFPHIDTTFPLGDVVNRNFDERMVRVTQRECDITVIM